MDAPDLVTDVCAHLDLGVELVEHAPVLLVQMAGGQQQVHIAVGDWRETGQGEEAGKTMAACRVVM